jgi:hypothetical protein
MSETEAAETLVGINPEVSHEVRMIETVEGERTVEASAEIGAKRAAKLITSAHLIFRLSDIGGIGGTNFPPFTARALNKHYIPQSKYFEGWCLIRTSISS